jgi:hypothetical protein
MFGLAKTFWSACPEGRIPARYFMRSPVCERRTAWGYAHCTCTTEYAARRPMPMLHSLQICVRI